MLPPGGQRRSRAIQLREKMFHARVRSVAFQDDR
jgi:hypothetical protein